MVRNRRNINIAGKKYNEKNNLCIMILVALKKSIMLWIICIQVNY